MIDWTTAKDDVLEAALEESEKYLAGTVSIAAAADQRAAVIAGTFATAGAALVAGVIGYAAASTATINVALPVYVGGIAAATLFILGSVLCIRASLPIKFNLPGTVPAGWESDVRSGRPLIECKRDIINFRQETIEENVSAIERNAKRFLLGAYCGAAAPVVGGLASVAVFVLQHLRWI
jgi:hypothetical protein